MSIFKNKERKEINITKDMTISEVLKINKKMEKVLMGFDMGCLHCPMAAGETLEEACEVHGIEADFLIKKIKENV